MNVLVVAPHPDDEAIGCGGTLRKHVISGDAVDVVFLSSGELGLKDLPAERARDIRESEAQSAAAVLGCRTSTFLRGPDWQIKDAQDGLSCRLAEILDTARPSLLYVPHPAEWHPDHQVAAQIVQDAVARSNCVHPKLMLYEVWTAMMPVHHLEDVSGTIRDKLRAIRCYRSQLTTVRYDRASLALNLHRGLMSMQCRYAEAFQTS